MKYQELEQQAQLVSAKGKKDQPTLVDFRASTEYLDELAQEYLIKINEIIEKQQAIIIGMIFDDISCKFTKGATGTMQVVKLIALKFRKQTIYSHQALTSRLSINMIVLDQDPSVVRKLCMQTVSENYRAA